MRMGKDYPIGTRRIEEELSKIAATIAETEALGTQVQQKLAAAQNALSELYISLDVLDKKK